MKTIILHYVFDEKMIMIYENICNKIWICVSLYVWNICDDNSHVLGSYFMYHKSS